MTNPCLQVALHELSLAGVRDVERAYGSKHLQLRWRINGITRVCTLPITPSDVRSPNNTRAQVRQLLKEDGLLPTERKPPAPRPESRVVLLERRVAALEQRLALLEQIIGNTVRGGSRAQVRKEASHG
jgi:hypothetical protein